MRLAVLRFSPFARDHVLHSVVQAKSYIEARRHLPEGDYVFKELGDKEKLYAIRGTLYAEFESEYPGHAVVIDNAREIWGTIKVGAEMIMENGIEGTLDAIVRRIASGRETLLAQGWARVRRTA